MAAPETFWMVYGLGQRQPTVRHKTFASAQGEAERLARTVPGVAFYVLEAVSVSRRVDVETIRLREGLPYPCDDEIPF
ncbi:hypothetical protein NA8A_18197 [Nitratireductor indicus C115]|uniref:Uncharacterized protein n=1 Tax=Nitratireductor indicus C115 TaxID=1231190 RepID=K2NSS3_9HYPH|nr:hypothetical protein [Nitratireductor indicus]EKF40849.1 hypothetical protein NA8A_18197 [Nitratireductor indicus C115]SFQ33828.1 hypothetical protein SAMN05216176_102656 [Nitratireductor indicus]